ncbi:hypothetical protein C3L33_17331, partial [Rhododendron williamsianum]
MTNKSWNSVVHRSWGFGSADKTKHRSPVRLRSDDHDHDAVNKDTVDTVSAAAAAGGGFWAIPARPDFGQVWSFAAAAPPDMVVPTPSMAAQQASFSGRFFQQQPMGEASAARVGNYLPIAQGHLNLLASLSVAETAVVSFQLRLWQVGYDACELGLKRNCLEYWTCDYFVLDSFVLKLAMLTLCVASVEIPVIDDAIWGLDERIILVYNISHLGAYLWITDF